jgi:hypothetical protein
MNRQQRAGTVAVGVGTVVSVLLAGVTAPVPAADLPSVEVDAPSLPNVPSLSSPPQLPSAPGSPSLPDVPAAPRLEPPSSLPKAPDVQIPSGQGPAEGKAQNGPAGGNGVAGSVASPGSSGTATRSGASTRAGGATAVRRAGARPVHRSRSFPKLRRRVARLQGCFYAISAFERRVLLMRTGLGGRRALSGGEVAARLGVSKRRVRHTEGHALRRLGAANHTDGCGRVGSGGEVETGARIVVAAAQDGPALQPVGSLSSRTRPDPGASAQTSRSAVLGAHRSSTPEGKRRGTSARLALAGGEPSSGETGAMWALIAVALAVLSGLLLLLLRHSPRHASDGPLPPGSSYPRSAPTAEADWAWPSRPAPSQPRPERRPAGTGPAPSWPARPGPAEARPEAVESDLWTAPWAAPSAPSESRPAPESFPRERVGAHRVAAPGGPRPSHDASHARGTARVIGFLAYGVASLVFGRLVGRHLRHRR